MAIWYNVSMYKSKYYENSKHPCLDCGKPCSPVSERCAKCARKLQKGKKHPKWVGGRTTTSYGYIMILRPDHPRANKTGYVREHIYIWEIANDKVLPKGWIVHHLNGMPSDNRPSNLVALPNRKHYHVFQAKAKRIQELEARLNGQHQGI